MKDEDLAALRDRLDPAWSELRERRVLERALETRRAEASRGHPRSRPRHWPYYGAAVVAAAAIAGVVWSAQAPSRSPSASPSSEAAGGFPRATTVGEGGSRLSFADGSYALLEPHAHVDIQAQAPSATAVVQHAGEVRYEVVHAPDREFVVHAKGIRVEVRGTSFSVTIDDGVRVVVHSGLVRVSDGRRALDLRRGESLEMANAPEAEVDEAAEDDESGVPSAVEPASGFDEGRSAASGAAETDPGAGSAPPHPTAAELLARADEARRDGQLALAARHLQQLLGDHPRDRRVPSALFTLGRIARTQGRYAEAAGRFAAYRERAPAGALYEDALAEEASSLAAAGERERARAVARHYLSRFAGGPHTARVQRLIE